MSMLRRTVLTRLALVTVPLLATTAQAAATVGQAAPDFTLRDTGGKPVRLSELRGRHLVLEWTNPGCPFVQKHYRSGNLPTLQKEAVAKNVVWLAINSTSPDHGDYLSPPQLARWMDEQRAAASAALMDEDGRVGHAFGARTTPHMYLIDPQGRLIYAGGIDSIPSARVDDIARATNHVRQALDEALNGRPVSRPTTPPYGCSIKYAS
jgi:peroxiredoxin